MSANNCRGDDDDDDGDGGRRFLGSQGQNDHTTPVLVITAASQGCLTQNLGASRKSWRGISFRERSSAWTRTVYECRGNFFVEI